MPGSWGPKLVTSARNALPVHWLFAFGAAMAASAAILIYFHDRFWWPPDEGAYAYVAARILAGDVLNRDIQDIHMGYVNFFNAFAFRLFGDQLVSLRLPLVAAGFIQACILFLLMQPHGKTAAMAAAITLTALSFIQFLNPTAHWYALFLMISIIGCLRWMSRDNWWRIVLVGFLLGTLILFRQLSGAIAAIGVMTYLLCEAPKGATGKDTILGRILIAVMFIALGVYLVTKTDLSAFLLFGIWPLALLVREAFRISATNREVARQLAGLFFGGMTAAVPLLAYHIHYGSLGTWYADTVLAAFKLTGFDFISQPRHFVYATNGVLQIVAMESIGSVINGVFWISLVLATPVLGILLLTAGMRRGGSEAAYHPLPFLALFYSLVSVHYQIPIYLFYTVGLTLVGVLWMLTVSATRRRWVASVYALFLAASGLYYQAAQPLSRGWAGIFNGVRLELVAAEGLPRVGLAIEPNDIEIYRHISGLVDREVAADQTILAIPANAEIYYLTDRRSPFRFFNSALGMLDETELADALKTMRDHPPKLVFHRPKDKYNTPFGDTLIAFVRKNYALIESFDGFDVYRHRSP